MEKNKKYYTDILMSIALIEEFTIEIKDFSAFDKDIKTQSAVERQLAIIGAGIK